MTDSRIPPARFSADSSAGKAADIIREHRGEVSTLYEMLLHSPDIAVGWEHLLRTVRRHADLDARLRELVILRVAVLNDAPYEFEAHRSFARDAGLSDEKIAAVREDSPTGLSDTESLVLDYCDAMTCNVRVSNELFEQVRQAFDEKGIVELTVTIAAYNMVSRFLEALHVR